MPLAGRRAKDDGKWSKPDGSRLANASALDGRIVLDYRNKATAAKFLFQKILIRHRTIFILIRQNQKSVIGVDQEFQKLFYHLMPPVSDFGLWLF